MAKYCFGVDVGGTTVKLGCFDTEGTLLEKWEITTRTANGGEAILPDVAASILDKMKEREISREDVIGVGVGAPGPIDGEGTVYNAVNLGWGTFSIKNQLQGLLNIPVEAGNDANVAALGEMWKGGGQAIRTWWLLRWEPALAAASSPTAEFFPGPREPQGKSDTSM